MTLYLFKTKFIIEQLKDNSKEKSHEFGHDILSKIVGSCRLFGYKFRGYWAYARTVDSYYNTNMDMLKDKFALHDWQIRTNLLERCTHADRLPAYVNGRVKNSVLSEGCYIEGMVENSLLSPGVVVAKDAQVQDSIIFHDTKIAPNSRLNRVICDKDARIGSDCMIGTFGADIPSREFHDLLSSGITLLGKNSMVQDKSQIGANTTVYAGVRVTQGSIEPGSTLR
jgi:glucose-1-phosphate adenylyltransferase